MTCTRAVLYIEDNANNVRLVERLLRPFAEVTLRVAATASEGVQAALHDRPVLILLDNRLPDATGSDVLRELAGSPDTVNIPVIILSGDSDARTAAELLAQGASAFLTKPFDIHQFTTLIAGYLSRSDTADS
jgi:CheY-like chemotaxis protein